MKLCIKEDLVELYNIFKEECESVHLAQLVSEKAFQAEDNGRYSLCTEYVQWNRISTIEWE